MAGKTSRSIIIHQKKDASPVRALNKQLRNPYLLITYIFLLLFVCLKLLTIPIPLPPTQTTKAILFQVQGTGNTTMVPNSAKLSFSITKTATTVADAQSQTSNTVNTILQSFKSAGIAAKNVATVNYSVFPQYNTDQNGKQIPSGYTVTQDLQATVSPIDKTNTIINVATENGANQIGGISFTIDDTTQKKLEEKARQDAINNAKNKAQSLARAAGIHLGKIVDVKESETTKQPPSTFTATGINTGNSQEIPQLPAGGNTITITVTISYETY